MDYAGFTIRDIGLLSAFFSAVQLLAEVPTGYFADRIGRIASIRVGAVLAAIATTIYVFVHHKTGIYIGVMFEALGYAFMGGAGQALIHDSLVVKKLEHEYTKIMSRAQSVSLIANAILIAIVPMTYAINPAYPFAIGTLAYLLLLITALFMHDVKRSISVVKLKIPILKQIVGKKNLLLFGLSYGVIAALYTSQADTFNVALREYGFRTNLIGWIYGIASVVGAAIGPIVHYLHRIKLSRYLLVDLCILIMMSAAAYTGSPYLLGGMMVISISFWRYRNIIYQSYLLNIYPTAYKATLVSAMSNLEQLNAIWLPLVITGAIHLTTIPIGLGLIGLFSLGVAPVFYYSSLKFFHRDPTPVALANQSVSVV